MFRHHRPFILLCALVLAACYQSTSPPAEATDGSGTAGNAGQGMSSGAGGLGGAASSGGAGDGADDGAGDGVGVGDGARTGTAARCAGVAPRIAPGALAHATAGTAYRQALVVIGAPSDQVAWTVLSDVPEGLSFVAHDPGSVLSTLAELGGTPSVPGTYRFAVEVRPVGPAGCAIPVLAAYDLVVDAGSELSSTPP